MKAKKCSCRRRPIRSTPRCSQRSARSPRIYRTDHTNHWQPDLDHIKSLINAKTRALVVIDPNNPTGADLSGRDAAGADRDRRSARARDPRRRGLRRSVLRRPGAGDGGARQRRADHFLFEPLEGVSRARVARRLDGRGIVAAPRSGAGRHQETRGRPTVQPRPDAVRRHRGADRRSLASGRVPKSTCASAPS